ncbi:class I SAM-dependent methyltransferase [Candidatus Falkowbacteria bacterium]|nr:class I SAM-dependent methyltransferase [Candidatus Falkowbacteria bacterium]
MKKELVKKYLEKVRKDYDFGSEAFSKRSKLWPDTIFLIKENVEDGDRVLDIGCGDGRWLEALAGQDINYVGIDNSRELIKIAKQKHKLLNVKFLDGDVLDLPFEDGGFSAKGGPASGWDKVLGIAVLHHIPSKELQLKALMEMHRVLRPGGKLIMTNWNLACETWSLKNIFSKKEKGMGLKDLLVPWGIVDNKIKRYYYAFSLSELTGLVKRAGFKVNQKYYTFKGKKSSFWKRGNMVVVAEKK